MASFRKYKNKKDNKTYWEYRIRYKDPLSNDYKETSKRGFTTKKEAQLAAYEIEQKLENKTSLNSTNLTYQEVYDQWWSIHSRTVKQSTRYTKLSKFNVRILPFFGRMKIKEITPSICQEFIDRMDQEVDSVIDFKIQANLVFKYAKSKKIISDNPMDSVIIPKKEKEFLVENEEENRNFLYKEEVKQFLSIAKSTMNKSDFIMFYLLIFFGMRKGELCALKWEDISFKDHSIKINKTLYFEQGKEIIQKTKNYSTRELYIDNQQMKVLKKWKIQQEEEFLKLGMNVKPPYVVCRDDLRPLRLAYPNDVLKSFYRQNKAIQEVTVHGLRHTFASLAFEAGATVKEVQAMLGHKDIQTTTNVYIHVTRSVKEKAATRINNLLNEL
ncbi:site-specific integrase [Heyndrickxia sp. FSL W8-0496]|uniref:site-specific integrase n=1 Tax=Heyndrickxia sp. FSL W8-0496 TaxID=2954702 RepID=UPI0030F55A9F